MRQLRLVAITLVLICLAGCAGNPRPDGLSTTLDAYASALRWGNFQDALGFVDPVYRKAHPLTPLASARYQQVRVAGYDAGSGPVPVGTDEVRQTVKLGLVNRNTLRERTVIDHQTWQWDATAKRWWLESGLPDITRPTPQP